jgi:hypothetical protein
MTLSSNAPISDIISEINRLQRRVDTIDTEKRAGRNVTGTRTIPSSATDLIQGDIVGDYLYNGTNYYELEVITNTGTTKWVRYTINTSF